MITIPEALKNIGRGVVYTPAHGDREVGLVVGASSSYIFVEYGIGSVKATHPEDLEWLSLTY